MEALIPDRTAGRRAGNRATPTTAEAGRDGTRHLKKSLKHFQPADVGATYQFIASEATTSPAAILCRVLGVSRSGYYAWRERPTRQDSLAPQVEKVFWQNSRRYGSRRITAELRDHTVVGRHRVRRLMRERGLLAIQPRRFVPRTTDSRHGKRMSPNLLLERAVKVDRPRQVMVGDITYLPLQNGQWAYLATWMDLFSRKILGWQIADSMTAELVINPLQRAILREGLEAGLIVHSDRGGQYVDAELRKLIKRQGFEQSMSRADETYDNAYAESLFSRYKAELLEDGAFTDLEQARSETFAYIEGYYNRTRRHSALGYLSPENFERDYYQRASEPRIASATTSGQGLRKRSGLKSKPLRP
jgi:putative transposase